MKYIDRAYGNFEIKEPVILELINSKTIQRLKDIDQAGYFLNSSFSHEPHILVLNIQSAFICFLKMYKAPIEEQIAGIIPDVSHSAFRIA